ncbi:unnamed protein product [Hymenolepis diminuta]|uniref:Integrase catalytic domain-containing protein n=1 Tax=Hymenolepis diminuta TaxID=6216 RepID=A0A564XWS8_HYMDI|nr:unnamed protein product [Hymenolepis diminuta]
MLSGSLRYIFSTHGLTETIITDSDIQFSSALFQDLCWSQNITCVHYPPHHPQRNDQAKRLIKTQNGHLRILYEADVESQTWVRHKDHLCHRHVSICIKIISR